MKNEIVVQLCLGIILKESNLPSANRLALQNIDQEATVCNENVKKRLIPGCVTYSYSHFTSKIKRKKLRNCDKKPIFVSLFLYIDNIFTTIKHISTQNLLTAILLIHFLIFIFLFVVVVL